jgi:hypothetical protein
MKSQVKMIAVFMDAIFFVVVTRFQCFGDAYKPLHKALTRGTEHFTVTTTIGRSVTLAVSRWLPAAEVKVRVRDLW